MHAGQPLAAAIFFGGGYALRETEVARKCAGSSTAGSVGVDLSTGFVMGCLATIPKMPFGVVKNRQQNMVGKASGDMSMLGTMRLIARQEGVSALWKGTGAIMLRMGIGQAIAFSVFRLTTSVLYDM